MLKKTILALALVAGVTSATHAQTRVQAMAPAELYVSDAILSSARLSPDGRYVVAVRSTATTDALVRFDWRTGATRVLQQVQRGEIDNQINWATWKSNNRLILGVSTTRRTALHDVRSAHIRSTEQIDVGITRIVAIDADGANLVPMFQGQARNLAYGAASTQLADDLPLDPDHVLVAAYGQAGYELFRANVTTGRTSRVDNSGWDGMGWGLDGAGNAVLRHVGLRNGAGYRIQRRAPGTDRWIDFADFRGGDQVSNPDFGYVAPGTGPGLVWVYARPQGHDTAGLYLFNTATGAYGDVQYEHAGADYTGDIWMTRENDRLLAACLRPQRRECRYFDDEIGRHIRAVDAFFGGGADVTLVDMSEDENIWLVYVQGPQNVPSYYIYDRAGRAVEPVSATRPITDDQLSPMSVVNYTGRDGAQLWGYLTTPRNGPTQYAPLVVLVHGGPEARDYYGFDREVQFLASRGYAVFQPQFRGSGGFGTAFANAGRREWGQRMQHDVTDGVRHLVASGAVDANRVCIVGHSYGGYAALAGASLTPDVYRCAIGINGVYDLRNMLRWEVQQNARLSATVDYWRNSIGNPSEDSAAIDAVSPRRQAGAIQIPVLLVAGEQDWTVPVEQSRDMRDALRSANVNNRYVEIPREGHSWTYWELENRVRLFTEVETFLNQHIGAQARAN